MSTASHDPPATAHAPRPKTVEDERVGAVLGGRYKLKRILGAGGMGVVYEADDPSGARFAIKLLLGVAGGREEHARFAREARIMSTLSTPNVTRVLDAGIDPTFGAPYIVMELLSGEDADSLLKRCGPLPPAVAVRIVLRAAAGIEVAHAAGIVHRDVKPANIFLDSPAGAGPIAIKVCDFGIAKRLFSSDTMTQSGDCFGSPSYMSPEQARNAKHVDGRTDVWSLGMTLYELLSGRTAFDDAKHIPEMMMRLLSDDVPNIQDRAPWVSEGLAMVTHGTLLRDLDARCPNVGALIDALTPFSGGADHVDRSMLVPLSDEVRASRAPRAHLPRTWRDIEARVRSTPPPPTQDSVTVRLLGHVLGGRYPLLCVLGRGGMGAVYETRGAEGQPLAIKVIHGEGGQKADTLARFVREARAVMSITSNHVVKVVDADTDPTQRLPFIVMELLPGQDLAALLRSSGALEPGPIVRLFVQACRGLADAHRLGIVHRDIKPANIFLQELPSGEVITKICDFGVAKKLFAVEGEETAADLTRTGGFLGSPMYFSPEQARNAKTVDLRTDVWSLAVSLYEALSARRPCESCTSVGEIIIAVCTQDVPPLQDVAPWIVPQLAAVIHKGLRRDAVERYATMDEFAAALEPFATSEPVSRASLVGISDERRAVLAPRVVSAVSSKTAYATTLTESRVDGPRRTSRAPYVAGAAVALLLVLLVGGLVSRSGLFTRAKSGMPSSTGRAPTSAPSALLGSASVVVPESATVTSAASAAGTAAAPGTVSVAASKQAAPPTASAARAPTPRMPERRQANAPIAAPAPTIENPPASPGFVGRK